MTPWRLHHNGILMWLQTLILGIHAGDERWMLDPLLSGLIPVISGGISLLTCMCNDQM